MTGSHAAMIAEGAVGAKVPLDFLGLCRQSVANFAAIRYIPSVSDDVKEAPKDGRVKADERVEDVSP
jgi:hypothetical protein